MTVVTVVTVVRVQQSLRQVEARVSEWRMELVRVVLVGLEMGLGRRMGSQKPFEPSHPKYPSFTKERIPAFRANSSPR